MDVNVLSLLDDALDTIEDFVSTSLISGIDFDDLIADLTDAVGDAIADVNQVVDETTSLVVNTLTNAGVDIDTVDVSSIVEDVVEFVSSLPEDATISDVLGDIVDSFDVTLPTLSDEDLLDLLSDVSDLINDIAPDLSQLSITPLLDEGVEFVGDLSESTGIIAIDGTSLSGTLTLDGSLPREFTTDLSNELDDLLGNVSDVLADMTGDVTLSDGQFTGDISLGGSQYSLSLDITEALTDTFTSLFSTAEATFPFADGILSVDIDTPLGEIDGTVDFADGDLDLNLVTPLGDVNTSIAFSDDAQFNIPSDFLPGSNDGLELDLGAGIVRFPLPGSLIDVPLNELAGEFGLSAGSGTFTLDSVAGLPIGGTSTFEVGTLASQLAVELTEDLSGELTIDAGEVVGNIVTGFGDFEVLASFDDLVLQARAVIDQTTGVLTLNDGLAAINLNTSFGTLSGEIALSMVENVLSDAANLLA
ncbi:MAG: hypothetical protein ACFB14_12080 [Leptolyngbyaceae cyanobacterium]